MKKIILVIISCIFFLPLPVFALTDSEIESFLKSYNSDLKNIKNKSFLESYPVGSIYITTNTSENTTSKMASLHGGTWEVYASGRSLIGVGVSYAINSTGGSSNKQINLGINNIPSHAHTAVASGNVKSTFSGRESTTSSSGSHSHILPIEYTDDEADDFGTDDDRGFGGRFYVSAASGYRVDANSNHNHSVTTTGSVTSSFSGNNVLTNSVGGGQPFSIYIQNPYISVYMYKRVS